MLELQNISRFPNLYFLLGVASFVAVFLLSEIVSIYSLKLTRTINLVDYPNSQTHKQHSFPTPIAGGLIVFITLLILTTAISLSGFCCLNLYSIIAFVTIFILGFIDDAIGLSAFYKFFGQFVASFFLILGGFQAMLFDSQVLNIIITVIWYIGIMNAFNFIDSADGLLLGVCTIIGITILFATLNSSQIGLNLFSACVLGLLTSLLLKNKPPAILFLGDSGSLLLGLVFAVTALEFNPLGFDKTTSWISPILLMAFPIFDTTLVVVSRIRNNRRIFKGSLDHTFHRLSRFCKKERNVYLIILSFTLLSNLLAIIILFLPATFAYIFFGLIIFSGIILLQILENFLSGGNHVVEE